MSLICAENLSVEFPVFTQTHRSLKNAVLNATTGGMIAAGAKKRTVVRALDNANFVLKEGDRVGLIGHNGSGKTTLLRVLSGVYEPTGGALSVKGKVIALLELSLGMDNEATGYENIFLRGALLGWKPRELKSHIEEIAAFSELGDYLEMPVKTYSSGMMMRLAFAISTAITADVLLMDEWLSVGDSEFNAKASARLDELLEKSKILVLATHSVELVRRVCNRVFRLEHGIMQEIDAQLS
jgi:lipopolysaccharide transport system ATP-binding protein